MGVATPAQDITERYTYATSLSAGVVNLTDRRVNGEQLFKDTRLKPFTVPFIT